MKNATDQFGKKEKFPFVVIVSGLPRSGTSMMMSMLDAGGIPLLIDQQRKPDQDNPKGYFEYQAVKRLHKEDTLWLKQCTGKAIKIVSPLLKNLPDNLPARIIFMRREMKEILLSQKKMLQRLKIDPNPVEESILSESFVIHLKEIDLWLAKRQDIKALNVNYRSVIDSPMEQARNVSAFLGGTLSPEKMAKVVDKTLYRQRNDRLDFVCH